MLDFHFEIKFSISEMKGWNTRYLKVLNLKTFVYRAKKANSYMSLGRRDRKQTFSTGLCTLQNDFASKPDQNACVNNNLTWEGAKYEAS